MSKPREWTIYGYHERTDNLEGRPIYRERIVGPKVDENGTYVIEKWAYDELALQVETMKLKSINDSFELEQALNKIETLESQLDNLQFEFVNYDD